MIPPANCTDRTVSCQAAINGSCGGRVATISHFDVLDSQIHKCASKSPAFSSVARGFAVCSKPRFWCVQRYIPADTEFDAFCVNDTPPIDGILKGKGTPLKVTIPSVLADSFGSR